MTALCSSTATPFRGAIRVPGDKSISHRALILSALTVGESQVSGILEGEDIQRTADALRAMGVQITPSANCWKISGLGVGTTLIALTVIVECVKTAM